MDPRHDYRYEPGRLEIIITESTGRTLGRSYYKRFVDTLPIKAGDRVLDYCSGAGLIACEIAKRLAGGRLVCADVSRRWLERTAYRLGKDSRVFVEPIDGFMGALSGGNYDIILMHYALHDFPKQLRPVIVSQLADNLKTDGCLRLREPIDSSHGIRLHELVNMLEHTKKLDFDYRITNSMLLGAAVDVTARKKTQRQHENHRDRRTAYEHRLCMPGTGRPGRGAEELHAEKCLAGAADVPDRP